jgi:hypothetical protein
MAEVSTGKALTNPGQCNQKIMKNSTTECYQQMPAGILNNYYPSNKNVKTQAWSSGNHMLLL